MQDNKYRYPSEFQETSESAQERARFMLGHTGKMISGSKGQYRYDNQSHYVIFNANVTTKTTKIWYGDLDLTLDSGRLKGLSALLNEDIYIFHESAARFDKETNFDLTRADAVFTPTGELVIVRAKSLEYSLDPKPYTEADYHYLKDGIPFSYTDEEMKKKSIFPKKPVTVLNENDFEKISFPNPEAFKGTKKESPVGLLLDHVQGMFPDDLKAAQEFYSRLWVTKSYQEKMCDLNLEYAKKILKVKNGYRLEQSRYMGIFDMPCAFSDTQSWEEEGFAYLKKK